MRYSISFELTSQLDLASGFNARVFPLINQAVNAVAQATAANWREAVMRARLWSGEKDAYAGSIAYRMTGDFSAVVFSDYKNAQEIETGRPPRDLKKMLQTSMKVRVSKKGLRYLIIPFRHGAPGSNSNPMPADVYQQAKMLTASNIVGHGRRLSGTGAWSLKTQQPATVRQRKYKWGERMDGPDVPRHQQGMVRMDTSTKNQKRSTYLTFRVMSEKSRGWIVPAQPGQNIVQGVTDNMRPIADRIFKEAGNLSMKG